VTAAKAKTILSRRPFSDFDDLVRVRLRVLVLVLVRVLVRLCVCVCTCACVRVRESMRVAMRLMVWHIRSVQPWLETLFDLTACSVRGSETRLSSPSSNTAATRRFALDLLAGPLSASQREHS
jgi:hypothetical protein